MPSDKVLKDTIINPLKYLLFGSNHPKNLPSDSLTQAELMQLRDGDLLLRRGYGTISDFIADYLEEKYPLTHAGILLDAQTSSPKVMHCIANKESNGIIVETLANYCQASQAGSLVAVRLKGKQDQQEAVLKIANNIRKSNPPFDFSFNHNCDSALYCLELIRNVYLQLFQKDYFSNTKSADGISVLRMNNFFNEQYFYCIFNHFDSAAISY